jgi:hypothetical protein
MSRKRTRELEDASGPEAKRQLVDTIKSFTSSFPAALPVTSSRKRQRVDSDDEEDDKHQKKRLRDDLEDLEDLGSASQNSPKQDFDPSKSYDQKARMEIYKILHNFKSWDETCQTLNIFSKDDVSAIAFAITCLPEWARLKALRGLRENDHERSWAIIDYVSEWQSYKTMNDPGSLFPHIFTKKYGDKLRSSAKQCYYCGQHYEEGANMVWKACGKHTMHTKCLKTLLENDSYEPLVGYCQCVPEN